MSGEGVEDKVKKLTRVEREREKIRVAQNNINLLLAADKEKQEKLNTRDKILLGVVLQGMIADGRVSSESFKQSIETYITSKKDRERCDIYFQEHRPKA
jgi:hypothetical protein